VLVEVLDAGGAVIFSFNDPARTGMWSVDAMALPAGMYTVRATATDAAGNTASDSVGFMVDTSAPMLIVSGPTAGQTFGAAINAAGGLTVTGDVDADAVVMVTILDGMGQVVATGMAMVNPDGSFSFVAPGQDLFVEGTYSVEVVAVRPNNQSAQVQLPIVVDLSTFGTVMPDMDLVTNDPTPTFSGTGEPGASVTVEFDGAPACTAQIDAQGMWACTPGGELSGAGVVSVTITDAVGNTVTIGGSTLTIDTTAPLGPRPRRHL
jgi:large repetitive protein